MYVQNMFQQKATAAFSEYVHPAAAPAIDPVDTMEVPGRQGADQYSLIEPMQVPQRRAIPFQKGNQAFRINSFNLDYNIPFWKMPLFLIHHKPTVPIVL